MGMDILFVPLWVLAVVILFWWLGKHILGHRLWFARDAIDDAEVTEEDYAPPEFEEGELDVPVASGEVGLFLASVAEALDGGLTDSQAEVLTLRIMGQKVDQVVYGTYFVKAGEVSGKLGIWVFREKAAEVIFSFRAHPGLLAVVEGVGEAETLRG